MQLPLYHKQHPEEAHAISLLSQARCMKKQVVYISSM